MYMRPISVGVILGVLVNPLPAFSQAVGAEEPAPELTPSVVLESIEITHVELDKRVLARNAEGEPQTFKESYMVRLALKKSAVPKGPVLNIFVGERRISELGGWQAGVYFYVYDPVLLERLAGGELFYQIGNQERRSLNADLDIGDLNEVGTVREGDLFPNRKKTEH